MKSKAFPHANGRSPENGGRTAQFQVLSGMIRNLQVNLHHVKLATAAVCTMFDKEGLDLTLLHMVGG